MNVTRFEDAETDVPEPGWVRKALIDGNQFSVEWFEKPPGHSSPMHDHENEQISVVLAGELTVYTEDDEVKLHNHDAGHLEPREPHRMENTGDETAIGLDIFAPGRGFEYWTDQD